MNDAETNYRVLSEARSWLGTPYQHQASTKHLGCDCLGLLRGVWRAICGHEPEPIPSYTADWDLVENTDQLLCAANRWLLPEYKIAPAVVLIFRWRSSLPAKHLAICSGEATIIHAYERSGVVETALGSAWQKRIAGIFRFPAPQKNEV